MASSIGFIILLSACASPSIKDCRIDIPDVWRHPAYEELRSGATETPSGFVLTDGDYRRVIKNQALCEGIRKNIIDFIDEVHGH